VHLPEDVRILIATKTKSNVRELEGALVKLIAVSSMSHSPITLHMAQQHLKYLLTPTDRRISMDVVLRAVAGRFALTPADAGIAAGDRACVQQTSHHGAALHPEDREAAQGR